VEVKERVELYLYSHSGPSGSVTAQTLEVTCKRTYAGSLRAFEALSRVLKGFVKK
jgi:hypothetical protein